MCEKPYFNGKYPYGFPCGRCPSCRLQASKAWQVRIMHHKLANPGPSYFLSITYAPQHLPSDYSLHHSDIQVFLKRLRKNNPSDKISYFCAGEYGPKTSRPHYHMILFGYNGRPDDLEKTWGLGEVHVGLATIQSAGYCAGYSYKKLSKYQYSKTNRKPPYVAVSRGIGLSWCLNSDNWQKCLKNGFIYFQGKKYAIPRYYFKKNFVDRQEYYKPFIESKNKADMDHYDLYSSRSVPLDDNTEYFKQSGFEHLDFIFFGYYTVYKGWAYEWPPAVAGEKISLRRQFNDEIRRRKANREDSCLC